METKKKAWSALVDTSVYQRLNLVEGVIRTQTVNWGGTDVSVPVTGYRRKRLRDGENVWLRNEINAMPTVRRMALEKQLRLCLYMGIRHETMAGSAGMVGTKGNLENDIQFEDIQPAVERNFFQKMQIFEYTKKEHIIDFCRILNTGRLIEIEQQAPDYWAQFPELTKTSLKNIGRFQQLLACLPEKHYPDAFHLWTAEVNGLDFFLVLDKKFISALTESAKIDLPTRPVLPSTMLELMGVEIREPAPVEDDRFYNLFE